MTMAMSDSATMASISVRDAFDRHMMEIALRVAGHRLGATAPNPAVGAVIANEATGEVLARAATAPGGRPHAETQAIAIAGARAKGATIYVTLEPCAHQGKTGPCAEAIIAAGIKRCVTATEDPDPRVAGRGLDRLRAAGVEVSRGLGAAAARWQNRGHIVRVTERRPLVTLKMAFDEAGAIARGDHGAPRWVTGAEARAHGHMLRALHDAILIGSGTVRDDDPELTCRLPGLSNRSPERCVLDTHMTLPLDSKLVRSARQTPVVVFATTSAIANDLQRREALAASGIDVVAIPLVGGKLWLPAVMEALVTRGHTRLLVEGGPTVWRAFAEQGLFDDVALYMSAGASAETATSAAAARARVALQRHTGIDRGVRLDDVAAFGGDRLWSFRRVAGTGG